MRLELPANAKKLEPLAEVTAKLKPTAFSISTAQARLLEKGDLWTGLYDERLGQPILSY